MANPNGYKDSNNLAYYNSLSTTDQVKFDTLFNQAKGWGLQGQGAFDTARTNYIASGGTNSKTKVVSPENPSSPTPSKTDQFDSNWNSYIKANQDSYNIETGRQDQKFSQNAEDLTTDYNHTIATYDWNKNKLDTSIGRTREDYAKYTGQVQQDTNRQLAVNVKGFATNLSAASSAYGQRGILRSGVSVQQMADNTQNFTGNQDYYKLGQQRLLDAASTTENRAESDYNTSVQQNDTQKGWVTDKYNKSISRNNTDLSNYNSDRATGSSILATTLQQQGDTVFNAMTAAQQATQQKQAEQDAINKMYGITSTPTRVPYRVGGKYIL